MKMLILSFGSSLIFSALALAVDSKIGADWMSPILGLHKMIGDQGCDSLYIVSKPTAAGPNPPIEYVIGINTSTEVFSFSLDDGKNATVSLKDSKLSYTYQNSSGVFGCVERHLNQATLRKNKDGSLVSIHLSKSKSTGCHTPRQKYAELTCKNAD